MERFHSWSDQKMVWQKINSHFSMLEFLIIFNLFNAMLHNINYDVQFNISFLC